MYEISKNRRNDGQRPSFLLSFVIIRVIELG